MDPRAAPRVLVVDDEFEMASLIAEELNDRGFEAVAMPSGDDAVQRLRRQAFDAVITDLRMPGVDGLELVRLSRELDPSRPVIVMTGHSALNTALEASRLGAYHYVTKPVRLPTLVHLLRAALGGTSPAVGGESAEEEGQRP